MDRKALDRRRQIHSAGQYSEWQTSCSPGYGRARTCEVYATRYDSGGAYTVAIPDKCIKLANGGSLACDGYSFGQNYW
jgi:hypothetical protein